MSGPHKTIEGIFLRPDNEQLARIWLAVADEGFTQDSDGVLKLLMLIVDQEDDEEEEEELPEPNAQKIYEYIKTHPEEIARVKDIGAAALKTIFSSFKKKNP